SQTASVTNSPQVYTGSPIAASVTCSGGGASSNIKYDGSSTTPTNVGTYAVTADCAAATNYNSATGVSAGNFVINKADQTISVTTPAPSSAAVNSSFSVAATAPGGAVAITSTGGCTG